MSYFSQEFHACYLESARLVTKGEAWKTSNSNSSGSTLEKVSGSWSMLKYLQIPKPCILLCCDLLRFSGFGPVHAGSQLLDFCSFSVYMLDCVQVLINLDCTSTHVNACTCDSLTLQWTWLWLLIITPTLVWVWELSYFRFKSWTLRAHQTSNTLQRSSNLGPRGRLLNWSNNNKKIIKKRLFKQMIIINMN